MRHIDHVHSAADGGPTTLENGQGLCEACNYAKQAPGWDAEAIDSPDGRHLVRITTPTGHIHHSLARRPHRGRRLRDRSHGCDMAFAVAVNSST
ncbi:HNH endonuclease [Rhodococcus sp. NPDC127528]|uniref:HNH endonuclease n=1 Tax=unclassified Rhodococcus (in: high G+C Gram-positive bacteria) TaxID=192944 RepID=UPI003636A23F